MLIKAEWAWQHPGNPSTREAETRIPWNKLASHTCQIGELQGDPGLEEKGRAITEDVWLQPQAPTSMYTCMHTSPCTRVSVCIPTCTPHTHSYSKQYRDGIWLGVVSIDVRGHLTKHPEIRWGGFWGRRSG